jgi:hypothetical protein
MMNLPFDPAKLNYAARINPPYNPQTGKKAEPARLSRLRVTLIGASGARHLFNLYTYNPIFEPTPRHFFSECGRVIVMRQRVTLPGDERATTTPGQYFVFFRGNRVPEERYLIRETIRESKPRVKARDKRSTMPSRATSRDADDYLSRV